MFPFDDVIMILTNPYYFYSTAGYYSRTVDADSSLRVLVLNTNLYLGNNRFTEGQEDPGGQLAWVNATLTSARQDGEKVAGSRSSIQ